MRPGMNLPLSHSVENLGTLTGAAGEVVPFASLWNWELSIPAVALFSKHALAPTKCALTIMRAQ